MQNSRRDGSEFVNEFWKVIPIAVKRVYDSGNENCRKVAIRLVDVWEQRKLFGSRGQNLRNEMLGKSPPPPVNPIKVMKRDATSLTIKLAVGGLPEKIMTSMQLVHDETVDEEAALDKFHNVVSCVREIEKDALYASSQGNLHGSDVVDNIEKQENMIKECISKLEKSEAVRVALVSQLREALQDQESKLEQLRSEILKVGSKERENSVRRSSLLPPINYTREESQVVLSRTSNNFARKWSGQDYKCHITEELEHRIGMIETSLSRFGLILDSVQSDIMLANKGTKELLLETKDVRQKLNAHDGSLQLMNKGQEDIKTCLDMGLKSLSEQLKQILSQENSGQIISSLSALSQKIDSQMVKLQNDLHKDFCKEIQHEDVYTQTSNFFSTRAQGTLLCNSCQQSCFSSGLPVSKKVQQSI